MPTTTTDVCQRCWPSSCGCYDADSLRRVGLAADVRRYELFDIEWPRGSRWTGFDFEDAVRWAAGGTEVGRVVRRTFEVTVAPDVAHIYQPGIGEAEDARWAAYEAEVAG